MRNIIIAVLILTTSCNSDTSKSEDNNLDEKEEYNYEEILEVFFLELSKKESWDDTQGLFYEYFYEPDSILNGELTNYFLVDFEMFWKISKKHEPPYVENGFNFLIGDKLKESSYELMLLNDVCDECVVLQPLDNLDFHIDICFKDGKIYSTIGTFDLENGEFIWYRDKKHPPMRFN